MNLTSSRHHSDACKPIQPAPLKVENTGHSLQINFPLSHDDNPVIPGGYVLLLGRKHHLRQIHFHAPSEHRVHGEAHRMEAHFVHATDRGQLLVMGLFMDVAGDGQEAATFLDWIIPVAGQCDIKGKQSEVEPSMDLEAVATVIRKSVSYYCYQGSLTTPPLSDGVYWLLCSDVVKFRLEVISAIETDLPKRNFRPAQLSHAHARPTNLRTEFRLFL
ncbi:alpha carbonic anhydrase [Chytriomyces sp. MP71]|nr:alpha carbonic anhydrase [Chytriomyces sp. MP71]